ncbi:MAG: carotenoid biosynthesis protein [Bacteroidetes bacterium]|nr:carotenoid biosynthesis protein [Bacteroidota bacterium]
MFTNLSKNQWATIIAIIFHIVGLLGIAVFKNAWIIQSTPYHLLLMFALIIWTQPGKNLAFLIFMLVTFCGGMAAEVMGVNTRLLFGDYAYGTVLGYSFKNVPLVIGVNWVIIIYCCGISVHTLLTKAIEKLAQETNTTPQHVKLLTVVVDGATLAVGFDWLMEPVAVKLGYWKWMDAIPFYNYLCWFVIAAVLLVFFHYFSFRKQNKFAVHLLMIQVMFFLLLRTFYLL